MTLLAACKMLLYRYSGQQDICVGTGVAGRQQKDLEGLIGFFVNLLALRTEVDGHETFTTLLQKVKATTLEAYAHQDLPFEKVVDVVVKERDMSRSPLFQVLFVMQNLPEVPPLRLGQVELISEPPIQNIAKFDITFFLKQNDLGLSGTIEYCTDLYTEHTIVRMLDHFKQLLTSIVQAPHKRISTLRMLGNVEEQKLLLHTPVPYPTHQTIITLFEEQVQKTPYHIAVVLDGKQLTYKELNERANQLAHHLLGLGVKAEALIPICIERSVEMIIGILGILKSGGAYVPIDPEYPEERIGYMLEDIAANLIVTSTENFQKLSRQSDLMLVDIGKKEIFDALPVNNPQVGVKPNHLAYIIYTSGSTGKPKGVLIEHRNVVRLFKNDTPIFDFSDKDVWTLFHSFSFDFSVWEIFGALLFGGKLVIVTKEVTKDVSLFADLLAREKVTVLNQTPSAFYVLQDQVMDTKEELQVRYVIFGGEALSPSKLEAWKSRYTNCQLINMYGITETTVHVTYQPIGWNQIKEGKSVIGKPIPTLGCYILDPSQNLVPIGVAGELYVSGAGVARGYLNRPEITAEKFIADPFNAVEGAKIYRTGDLGKWLDDGSIEYLGRKDDQVKIRGYRIELGEIENVLSSFEGVRDTIATVKENKITGSKLLNAYLQVDREELPLLNNYLQLLPVNLVKPSELNLLPNHLPIFSSNLNEVKFLYHEIFEENAYLRHGITLSYDSVVFDVVLTRVSLLFSLIYLARI